MYVQSQGPLTSFAIYPGLSLFQNRNSLAISLSLATIPLPAQLHPPTSPLPQRLQATPSEDATSTLAEDSTSTPVLDGRPTPPTQDSFVMSRAHSGRSGTLALALFPRCMLGCLPLFASCIFPAGTVLRRGSQRVRTARTRRLCLFWLRS